MSDLISRQAAIDAAVEAADEWDGGYDNERERLIREALEKLPSVQPRKGKWIYGEKDGQDGWYCSKCEGFIPWYYDFYGLDNIDFIADFKSCPFCRAEMLTYTGKEDIGGEHDESIITT